MRLICLLLLVAITTRVRAYEPLRRFAPPANTPHDAKTPAAGKLRSLKSSGADTLSERGAKLLQEYNQRGDASPCWKSAVRELHLTCETILEVEQQRKWLAYAFMQCQLESDRKWPEELKSCENPNRESVATCVEQLPQDLYSFFVHYGQHIDVLCFHLQDHIANERMQRSVHDLRAASTMATDKISELMMQSDSLVDGLSQLTQHQRHTLAHTEHLSAALETMSKEGKTTQELMSARSSELRTMAGDVAAIKRAQSKLLEEQQAAAEAFARAAAHHNEALEIVGHQAIALQGKAKELGEAQSSAIAAVGELKRDVQAVEQQQRKALESGKVLLESVSTLSQTAAERLQAQLAVIDAIDQKSTSIAVAAKEHSAALAETATHIGESLNTFARIQGVVARYVVNVETAAFYILFALGIIVVTMAERTHRARLTALVVGPLAAFAIERYAMAQAAVVLSVWQAVRLELRLTPSRLLDVAAALPSSDVLGGASAVWSAVANAATSAARNVAAAAMATPDTRDIHQVLAWQEELRTVGMMASTAVIIWSAMRFEAPEDAHRRIVREEMEAMFASSGLTDMLRTFEMHQKAAAVSNAPSTDASHQEGLVTLEGEDDDESLVWVNPAYASGGVQPDVAVSSSTAAPRSE